MSIDSTQGHAATTVPGDLGKGSRRGRGSIRISFRIIRTNKPLSLTFFYSLFALLALLIHFVRIIPYYIIIILFYITRVRVSLYGHCVTKISYNFNSNSRKLVIFDRMRYPEFLKEAASIGRKRFRIKIEFSRHRGDHLRRDLNCR